MMLSEPAWFYASDISFKLLSDFPKCPALGVDAFSEVVYPFRGLRSIIGSTRLASFVDRHLLAGA